MGGDPHECPACNRVFNWGIDNDSALVGKQGQQWLSCSQSAYWKRNFHMEEEHPEIGFYCPKRQEGSISMRLPGKDYWMLRSGYKCCSFCGSMEPAQFFKAVLEGATLIPTDYSSKVRVHGLPNPDEGKMVVTRTEMGPCYDPRTGEARKPDLTDEEKLKGYYERSYEAPAPATTEAKFYFQHLTAVEQRHFIDLYNAGKMKVGAPGHFYVKPFFCEAA